MADIAWTKALNKLENYVFKIMTPSGSGTGFLISLSENICGVATAFHVVQHEYEWEEPIKMLHYKSGNKVLLRKPDRVIWPYQSKDLAFILFDQGDFKLPADLLDMKPSDKYVRQGVQMGWCGFPNIASSDFCFFTGHVSAFLESIDSYLVDGVVIHGVSGGPAFTVSKDAPDICGVVSAYIANRATGETLPGVCLIRDVAPYQDLLSKLKSLDQAKEKEKIEVAEPPAEKKEPDSGKPVKNKTVKNMSEKKSSKKIAANKKVLKNKNT